MSSNTDTLHGAKRKWVNFAVFSIKLSINYKVVSSFSLYISFWYYYNRLNLSLYVFGTSIIDHINAPSDGFALNIGRLVVSPHLSQNYMVESRDLTLLVTTIKCLWFQNLSVLTYPAAQFPLLGKIKILSTHYNCSPIREESQDLSQGERWYQTLLTPMTLSPHSTVKQNKETSHLLIMQIII